MAPGIGFRCWEWSAPKGGNLNPPGSPRLPSKVCLISSAILLSFVSARALPSPISALVIIDCNRASKLSIVSCFSLSFGEKFSFPGKPSTFLLGGDTLFAFGESPLLTALLFGASPFLGEAGDPCFPDADTPDLPEELRFSLLSLSRVEHLDSIFVLWSSSLRCAYRAPATSFRRNSCVS